MKFSSIRRSIELAKRFFAAAERVERRTAYDGTPYKGDYVNTGKSSAAARRASMDLTRQLSEMRKP